SSSSSGGRLAKAGNATIRFVSMTADRATICRSVGASRDICRHSRVLATLDGRSGAHCSLPEPARREPAILSSTSKLLVPSPTGTSRRDLASFAPRGAVRLGSEDHGGRRVTDPERAHFRGSERRTGCGDCVALRGAPCRTRPPSDARGWWGLLLLRHRCG